MLNCSNSLLVCGVYIDGEESDGTCIDYDVSQQNYLSLFYNEEDQRNKEQLEQNKEPLLEEDLVKIVIVKEAS